MVSEKVGTILVCNISDILPVINGAQGGYTLKDINAGRNSSGNTA